MLLLEEVDTVLLADLLVEVVVLLLLLEPKVAGRRELSIPLTQS